MLAAATGETALAGVRRLRPDLLIAERCALDGDGASLPAGDNERRRIRRPRAKRS